jgi:cytochrome c oxidase subunit 3/cytochrome o ubiquinol oxidase subunit 3
LTDIAHPLAAPNPHLETSTGLDSRKLAIWTFLGSECMFFASLISTYVVYRGKSLVGPFPHTPWTDPATGQVYEPIIEIPLVTVGTALLLFSSLFVVLALANAQRGNRAGLLVWLAATIMCGFFFVGMQVYEFTHFVHKGLTLKTNLFGASFFTLTGFHGTHVTLGVIWLLTLWIEAFRGKIPPAKSLNLEIAALYWHFVDVVWIVIFPVVYLIK